MTTGPFLQQQSFLLPYDKSSQLTALADGYSLGYLATETPGLHEALWIVLPTWQSQAGGTYDLPLDLAAIYGQQILSSWPFVTVEGQTNPFDQILNSDEIQYSLEGVSIDRDDATTVLGLSVSLLGESSPSHSLLIEIEGITQPTLLPLALTNQELHQVLLIDSSIENSDKLLTLEALTDTQAGQTTRWHELSISGGDFQSDFAAGSQTIALDVSELASIPGTYSDDPFYVQVSLIHGSTQSGLDSGEDSDVLLTAWNADGTIQWESLFGNTSDESHPQVVADANKVVVAASLDGVFSSFNTPPTKSDHGIGIASYSLDGELRWKRRLGDDLENGSQFLSDLLIADDGTILVLGRTQSAIGLHGQSPLGSQDDVLDFDAFITAYSPGGDRLWTHQFGSLQDDYPESFALMPLQRGNELINTLVVAGYKQAIDSVTSRSRGWLHYFELPDDLSDIDESLIPPSARINYAVIDDRDPSDLFVDIHGYATPGSKVLLQLSSDQLNDPLHQTVADQATGLWSIQIPVDAYLKDQITSDHDLWVRIFSHDPSSGLVSDSHHQQIYQPGSGMPSDHPQILWIDSDGGGPLSAVPLIRQFNHVGGGVDSLTGQQLLVDYTGTRTDGFKFDSSKDINRDPFKITIDESSVIQGWHEGLRGVPVGSQIQLIIPPELAYGVTQPEWLVFGNLLPEVQNYYPDIFGTISDLSDVQFGSVNATSQLDALDYARRYESLFEPGSISVQLNQDPDIPSSSTLVFDVDLRADLTGVEDFLRDVAFNDSLNIGSEDQPQFITAYSLLNLYASDILGIPGSDVLDFASAFGPGDGSDLDESILVPASGYQSFLPVMALGGLGDDEIIGSFVSDNSENNPAQSVILFGESGDDSLVANSNVPVAYLDGGDGDDYFSSAASLSFLRGGSGYDTLTVNDSTWELVGWDLGNPNSPVFTIALYDNSAGSNDISNTIHLNSVESIQSNSGHENDQLVIKFSLLTGASVLPASVAQYLIELEDLPFDFSTLSHLKGTSAQYAKLTAQNIPLFDPHLILTDSILLVDPALDLFSSAASVDLSLVNSLNGSLEAVLGIFYDSRFFTSLPTQISDQDIILTDSIYSASDLLDLQTLTSGAIQLERSSTPLIEGSFVDIQALFDSGSIAGLDLADFLLTDSDFLEAESLLYLASSTSGLIDATYLSHLQGGNDSRNNVFNDSSISLSIFDDIQPDLMEVRVSGGVYGPLDTITFELEFSEPVQFSSPSLRPELLLSGGFTAEWVSSQEKNSQIHHFELLLDDISSPVDLLGVESLVHVDLFTDHHGNILSSPGAELFSSVFNPPKIVQQHWTLDIDNDGSITALGDGLMVIRYLFGSAFAGDSLTQNAANFDLGRRTNHQEIRSYLDQAYEQGLLDVDRDGQTLALTDGLMIIRSLFGSAFAGSSLINNAIHPDSDLIEQLSFIEDPNNLVSSESQLLASAVQANIQSLF